MSGVRPVEKELSRPCSGDGMGRMIHSMLTAEWSWTGAPGGIYALFQEMEEKDAQLFATLQTRKNALLACPYKVVAGNDTPQARRAAELVEQCLAELPAFHRVVFHLMDALAKGFAIAEIIWKVDDRTGRVHVTDIRARSQGQFAFDDEDRLYLLQQSGVGHVGSGGEAMPRASGAAAPRPRLLPRPGETATWHYDARPLPAKKFLHFAFQGSTCSPYGAPLCIKAYWYYWLKKSTLDHWSLFNEKFGSPTAVARYGSTVTDDDLRRLEETIASLPRDRGVLLPEEVSLEFLEARRASGSNTYRDLADWCNEEIAKIVLGQTLTTNEGRRTSSYALGQVHDNVRRDYLASDAAAIGQVLTSQLSRWITDFNLGADVPAPRIVFDVAQAESFEAELKIDRELVKMGVPLTTAYFYERYRRRQPRDGEHVLRYDDANLYQYHLLHGVLTVNEVRATLGLPPVAWGEHPTGSATAGDAVRTRGNHEGDPTEDETEQDEGRLDRLAR